MPRYNCCKKYMVGDLVVMIFVKNKNIQMCLNSSYLVLTQREKRFLTNHDLTHLEVTRFPIKMRKGGSFCIATIL